MPDEFKTDHSSFQIGDTLVSDEESTLLVSIQELDRAVAKSARAVAEAEELRGTTQNAEERNALSGRIKQLEAEKTKLKDQFAELEAQLQALTNGSTRLIKTEDHRPGLFETIKKARSELTIVSAWINPRALDDELCRTMAEAMIRGVRIRIAWGLGTTKAVDSRGSAVDRNYLGGNEAISGLKRRIRPIVGISW